MKKTLILLCMLFLVSTLYAQIQTVPSSNENYIYTKNYLDYPASGDPKVSETVQYFDKFGRPKQLINVKATPQGKDLVTPISYDEFGRQVDSWLPSPMNTLNGAIQSGVNSNATNYYGDNFPFTHKNIEASPIERVLSNVQPGLAWQNHPVNFKYQANILDDHVARFVTTTTVTDNTTYSKVVWENEYAVNQLYKSIVTDEDGNKAVQFTNGYGNIILLRKISQDDENADTYYVYNEFNQLAYIIPPKAVMDFFNAYGTGSNVEVPEFILNDLCYQYHYDGLNRLVEKKLPGKGWQYMVYDKQNRLVLAQDANLGAAKQWMFTKYDQFSRIVYKGIYTSSQAYGSQGRIFEQSTINTFTNNNTLRQASIGFNSAGMEVYYPGNTTYPTVNFKLLSVNYYDTYPPYSFNPAHPANAVTDNITDVNNTKGLGLLTLIKNIENDNWTRNYSYYDVKGREIGTYSINHLGGYTSTESVLDFSGAVKQTIVKHKRLNTDTERIIKETFEYDSQNRLLVHKHKVDNNTEEILTQNTYNEISQLSGKKVGGAGFSNPLQTIDYQYNIRGWMTKINDPDNLVNGKLFGYSIKYQNPENTEAYAIFNGNISEIDWKTQSDNVLRRYDFSYDTLNRFAFGRFTTPGATVIENNFYNEWADYDIGGNIRSLGRYQKSYNNQPLLIDNLTYTYTGNRLISVKDNSGNYSGYPDSSGNTIGYDLNGNMTDQKDRGIVDINYNHLDLADKFTFDQTYVVKDLFLGDLIKNVTTQYLYRSDGVKLNKKYIYGVGKNTTESSTVTDYLDGFQYEVQGNTTQIFPPVLKFIPTAEGYYNFENNKYVYNYSDHLGNVRLSYTSNGTGGVEVIEENNYYPFGLKHRGYNDGVGNPSYQYKYNGKELQEESGMYDYGARMYMPEIGRWGVLDPLAEKMTRLNPYNYAFDNPVNFIDPDGREGAGWGYRNGAWVFLPGMQQGDEEYTKRGFTDFRPDGSVVDNVVITNSSEQNTGHTYLGFNGEAKYVTQGSSLGTAIPLTVGWGNTGVGTGTGTIAGTGAGLSLLTILASAVAIWTLHGDAAVDTPADEPEDLNNLYLYRNMRSVGGLPELGNSLNTLGIRNKDMSNNIFGEIKADTDYVYGSSGMGMSVTPGYGNVVPVVEFATPKTTLFRIKATDVYRSGLGINVDKINHANITPVGRIMLQQFRTQIQATAPLWKPVR
ncbi:DUF6443 domain-containing protein [Chryseobacterium sp. 22543]|uniref:DUF6443 domain-containing protein n=1 Tax=Chryseobacterium sp. 22543 TaxID=3453940 RepID=UPI003F83B040